MADAKSEFAQYEGGAATVAMAMEPPSPPRGMPLPPQSAPVMQSRSGRNLKDLDDGVAFGGSGAASPAPPPPPPEAGEEWLDFDSLALADVSDSMRRGRLVQVGAPSLDYSPVAELERLQAHAVARDVRQTRGLFDHQFSAEGGIDVPGSAQAHRVYLLARGTACAMRFCCVACEDDRVFREVELPNPLNAPLLPGPVDVFVEGALLSTTELGAYDRGGTLRIGLGVEERLRVARNVRVSEESKGMLGTSRAVHHRVGCEVASSLPAEVQVEVIERVPVTADKEITVVIDKAEPRPEDYDQKSRGQPVKGGKLFRLAVKPGGKAELALDYTITLPAGSELVGGNRRE